MKHDNPLVLSVTSGKGGVGKTNLAVNLAYVLQRMGSRVLLMDADLGLANVDILLGLTPRYNIFHLLFDEKRLDEVLVRTKYGFSILPASSGAADMLALSPGQKLELIEVLDPLGSETDILIVDTGAGIGDTVTYFNIAAQERLLVVTSEPTSLTDVYATIKLLQGKHGVNRFKAVVNMVQDAAQAKNIYQRLVAACDKFLNGVSIDLVGWLPRDAAVRQAVARQEPLCRLFPQALAAQGVEEIARNVMSLQASTKTDGNIKFFWKKLLFGQ